MNSELHLIRRETAPPHPMNYHELACLFPMLGNEALADLTEDIRANGVREPIVLFEGQILDGRNRYHAAREVGCEYPVAEYVGPDPLGYVVSLNLKRRHLTESQRAMVAAKIAKMPKGRPAANTAIAAIPQAQAAAMMGVSPDSIQRARAVQTHGTSSLNTAVEMGAAKVSAAAEVAKLPEPMQDEVVEAGPEAIKAVAAEIRNSPAPAEPDEEARRAVVVEAARRGLQGERRPAARNPDYRPNPAFDAMSALTGSCRRINEIVTDKGLDGVLAGFLDAAMVARNLPDIEAARDHLNLILERCNADQAAA